VILYAHDQPIVEVPRRSRFGALAFHPWQRFCVPGNLFEGHLRRVGRDGRRQMRARTTAGADISWPAGAMAEDLGVVDTRHIIRVHAGPPSAVPKELMMMTVSSRVLGWPG
jgi:hypothetical protein